MRSIQSKQLLGVTAFKPAVCLPWSLFELAGVQFEWPRRRGVSQFLVPTFWVDLTRYYRLPSFDGSGAAGRGLPVSFVVGFSHPARAPNCLGQ